MLSMGHTLFNKMTIWENSAMGYDDQEIDDQYSEYSDSIEVAKVFVLEVMSIFNAWQ